MYSFGRASRGGRNGGQSGRGNQESARAIKRMREQAHRGSAAATCPAARSAEKEEGEITPGPSGLPNQSSAASYAQATAKNALAEYIPHTHHSQGRDIAVPQPFEDPPHLLVTGVFTKTRSPPNELLFYRLFEPGQAATREALQLLRADVAREVTTQFNIKLTPPTPENDPITIVTKRDSDNNLHWTLTGDIRIQFASPGQAKSVYHQQRGQRSGNQAGCLRTFNDHRCVVIIPDGTTRPAPEDRDLHRIYMGCDAFRGESQLSIEGPRRAYGGLKTDRTHARTRTVYRAGSRLPPGPRPLQRVFEPLRGGVISAPPPTPDCRADRDSNCGNVHRHTANDPHAGQEEGSEEAW